LTALAIFISKIDRRRSERTVRCPQSAGFAGNESARRHDNARRGA